MLLCQFLLLTVRIAVQWTMHRCVYVYMYMCNYTNNILVDSYQNSTCRVLMWSLFNECVVSPQIMCISTILHTIV